MGNFIKPLAFRSLLTIGLILMSGITCSLYAFQGFPGGDGSPGDPYHIDSAELLDAIRNDLEAHYILISDIDLGPETSVSGGEFWNGGDGWEPIGDDGNRFTGSLDGAEFKISDLHIDRDGEQHVGLFGALGDGSFLINIDSLHVEISGGSRTGGLVGSNFGGTITSISVYGTVSGTGSTGGLSGFNDSNITDSSFNGTVSGSTSTGGLVGSNLGGDIHGSSAEGTVNGNNEVGGLVGDSDNTGSIIDGFADVNVTGDLNIGGLVGRMVDGNITGGRAEGNVTGNEAQVGGLVGLNMGTVSWSYATGDVDGEGNGAGGLIGNNQGTISNSYARGNVTGVDRVGGLAGINGGSIDDSYSIGNPTPTGASLSETEITADPDEIPADGASTSLISVTLKNNAGNEVIGGGLVASGDNQDVSDSFWDIRTSGRSFSAGGTGDSTNVLTQEATFTNAGWDFNDIWEINPGTNDGYPFLQDFDPGAGPGDPGEADSDVSIQSDLGTLDNVIDTDGSTYTADLTAANDPGVATLSAEVLTEAIVQQTAVVFSTGDDPFITIWKTDNAGTSNFDQITIPGTGTDYIIQWVEVEQVNGEWQEVNDPLSGALSGTDEQTITFPSAGTYQVNISGDFTRIHFNNSGDAEKILDVVQWGDIEWSTMEEAFFGASNLDISAEDVPDLSNVTSLTDMLRGASSMNGDISGWDISSITSMRRMFQGASSFNQDIDGWDVSSVTDMFAMFRDADSFNQDLNSWIVSNVTDMANMFRGASAFNGNISDWDVSNVTDMTQMFLDAEAFNQDIGDWDTASVTDMFGMFRNAETFDQDISGWTTDNVTRMNHMFWNAAAFNQDIGGWNTGNVTEMPSMFREAASFDQNLGDWDISSVDGGGLSMANIFDDSGMSIENFDATLIGWGQQTVDNNVNVGAAGIAFCKAGNVLFELANNFNWTIENDGQNCPGYFVTVWKSDNPGDSENDQITIPGEGTNYEILWVEVENIDGDWVEVEGGNSGSETATDEHTVTFQSAGIYRISISSDFTRINFGAGGDPRKILDVVQWGDIEWTSMASAFWGARNLDMTATDVPDLSEVTDMSSMFSSAWAFNGDISDWDVSNVTDMSSMFRNAREFNQDIDGWNVSNVTDMNSMFQTNQAHPGSFNQDLNNWNTENVTDMSNMFSRHGTFNGEIGSWDTGNVTDMSEMFFEATAFNPDLDIEWNVENVVDMSGMFEGATAFNGNISSWNPVSVTDMSSMFERASAFNGDINGWNTESVTDMTEMFREAESFNQDLNQWNTSNVEGMRRMFFGASSFDGNIVDWDTGNVTNMAGMFHGAAVFNQDISGWNTDNLTRMHSMFRDTDLFDQDIGGWNTDNVITMDFMFSGAESFNQDISSWNVQGVSNMASVFAGAVSFNQDLSDWDVSNVEQMPSMFSGATSFNQRLDSWDVSNVPGGAFTLESMLNETALTTENYDSTLIGWSQLTYSTSVEFGAEGLFYCDAENERQILINAGWTITDEGEGCDLEHFITVWQSDNTGDSENDQITIPGEGTDYEIEWVEVEAGEVGWEEVDGGNSGSETGSNEHTITFPGPGTYQVSISGNFTRIHFNNEGDKDKILEVTQWGDIEWSTMAAAFYGASNLDISANDAPDLSNVTSMAHMFRSASSMNGEIGHWNTSNIVDMGSMFHSASDFNQDIGSWDTGSVTNMSWMFQEAISFNQDIGGWDTGNVTDMSFMLRSVSEFNHDISNWDVSNVTDFSVMFEGATSFNQDISGWETGNATSMSSMFSNASSFNQDISGWNTGNVENLSHMFWRAHSFNQDLSGWDTGNVTDMGGMFNDAESFDQNLGGWDISSVTEMTDQFDRGMLDNSGLSTEYYDSTLIGWSGQSLQENVTLGAEGLLYCDAEEERQSIIDDFNWTINDDGIGCQDFAGGDGSEENPWQISGVDGVDAIRLDLEAHYILIEDLDFGPHTSDPDGQFWNGGDGWEPIGTSQEPFTGTFNGDGHTLSNLTINRIGSAEIGLFGHIGEEGQVEAIHLEDVNIQGGTIAGSVIGRNRGSVTNVSATGEMTLENISGGIIGWNEGTGHLIDVNFQGDINGRDENSLFIGGINGFNVGTIDNAQSSGSIRGAGQQMAGIVAQNTGSVANVSSDMSVSGTHLVAGLVAWNRETGEVTGGTVQGDVTGMTSTGGAIGLNRGFLSEITASGQVTAEEFEGNGPAPGELAMSGQEIILNEQNEKLSGGSGTDPEIFDISQLHLDDYETQSGSDMIEAPANELEDVDLHDIGGLAGINSGEIEDGHASGNVTGNAWRIGGLVGRNRGSVLQSSATGRIEGIDYVGGLIGRNETRIIEQQGEMVPQQGEVQESFASGEVIATGSAAGGLVGLNTEDGSLVTDSYATGNVSGGNDAGGLVGIHAQGAVVMQSYSVGEVTSNGQNQGGLIGLSDGGGSVENSYWDLNASGQATSDGGEGRTTDEMVLQDTFDQYDFSRVWNIDENQSYPYLQNNTQDPLPPLPPGQIVLLNPENDAEEISILPEFHWQEDNRSEHYHLMVSEGSEFVDPVINIMELSAANHLVAEELEHETTYHWQVRGINEQGTGEWSESFSFTTIPGFPEQVVLSSPADGSEEIDLQPELIWEEAQRAEVYEIQIAEHGTFEVPDVESTDLIDTFFIPDDMLQFQTTYEWRVRAINDQGEGEWSESSSFTTVQLPEPSNLVLTGPDENDSILLNWDEVTFDAIDEILVFRGRSALDLELLDRVDGDESQYRDLNPMSGTSFYAIQFSVHHVQSAFSNLVSFYSQQLSVSQVWNLVSIPVKGGNYPLVSSEAYQFGGLYQFTSELVPGNGYWAKSSEGETLDLRGEGLVDLELGLKPGWNLVGAPAASFQVSQIDDPDGLLDDTPVYSFDGVSYQPVDLLEPGNGYWVFSRNEGSIRLQLKTDPVTESESSKLTDEEDHHAASTSQITFSTPDGVRQNFWVSSAAIDTETRAGYRLPPVAPDPELDVRTSSGFKISDQHGANLELTSSNYPVIAELSPDHADPDVAYRLVAETDDYSRYIDLLPGQPQLIQRDYDRITLMQIPIEDAITQTELRGNFPNPFRQETTIEFRLAEQAPVTLHVYDSIGRRVTTLVNGNHPPDIYQVKLNPNGLSSGIYILHLQAGSVNDTHKITVIR